MNRIGLIINNLAGGGAERVVVNLAKMFQKRDIDVHVFILEDVISYDVSGLNIHKITIQKQKNKLFKKNGKQVWAELLEKAIKEIELDGIKFNVLFSNLPLADRVVRRVNLNNKIYYIIHTTYSAELMELKKRGEFIRAFRRKRAFKKLYNYNDLICVSQGICNDLANVGIKPHSSTVIYNPFDTNRIIESAEETPQDMPDYEYMIHVGAFRKEKRHDILLEAYAKLHNPPKLILMCKHDEKLEKLINKFDLKEKVEIFGFRSNPYPYIKNAKLLVLSSGREGLPTVLVEALVLNTPIVSTNCVSGPSEILTGSLSGYLAKVNDSKDLADKIRLALVGYPNIDAAMIEKFKEENIYNEYKKLWEHN
ncbi:glycosyltransferase [Sulfurovum sp.]|uniref:glycosyltransferase n=1 Tax=Sulfurovum sp. TaxID=1969726 RepID=UPI0028680466|nr:glycosyltransferase [Sulfurovum sp.]